MTEVRERVTEMEELAEANYKLVYFVIHRYARNSKYTVDDLLGPAHQGYVNALKTYIPGNVASFSTYAVTCIRNEVCNFLRKETRGVDLVIVEEPLEGLSEVESSITDVEEYVIRQEYFEYLHSVIDLVLTEQEKKVIQLRYGLTETGVLTQREIGELLGVSQSYVNKVESRSLLKLREKLEKEQQEM